MIKNEISNNMKINTKELPCKTIIKLIKEDKADLCDLIGHNSLFNNKNIVNETINEVKKIIKSNINDNDLSAFIINLYNIRSICNKAEDNEADLELIYLLFNSTLFSLNINRKLIIWFIISYAYLESYEDGLCNLYEFDDNFNDFIENTLFSDLKVNNDTISIEEINKEINSEYGISINHDFAYEIAYLNNEYDFLDNKIKLYNSSEIDNFYKKLIRR